MTRHLAAHGGRDKNLIVSVYRRAVLVVTNTLKIMRATMLLSATSNGVGVNLRLVGYGLSVSRYQGIFIVVWP